jgi:hypothetical protein
MLNSSFALAYIGLVAFSKLDMTFNVPNNGYNQEYANNQIELVENWSDDCCVVPAEYKTEISQQH